MPLATVTTKVTTVKNDFPKIAASIRSVADLQVMVGIPMETTQRGDGGPLNNAEIAYIQEFGAPEANIPARPFLFPTVRANRAFTVAQLRAAGGFARNSTPTRRRRRTARGCGWRKSCT